MSWKIVFYLIHCFLSASIDGLGIDFSSYLSSIIDNVFLTDSDVLRTTNSVGFDISNDSSFDLISVSGRVYPSVSIFCSRFSAFISKTTSVGP